jgi:hypothetical protein
VEHAADLPLLVVLLVLSTAVKGAAALVHHEQ